VKPLLVVTNAAAGGTDDGPVEAALEVLRAATDVRREVCAEPGDLDRLLDDLGDRMLVIVGGDGSVHTAVATLHTRGELAADRPIGLVPLGTGNDLARTLGIPLDPADAARALVSGRPRPLDLVVDDAGGEDARGQQVQRVLLVADDDGVPGVVAAVVLHHVVDRGTARSPCRGCGCSRRSRGRWR